MHWEESTESVIWMGKEFMAKHCPKCNYEIALSDSWTVVEGAPNFRSNCPRCKAHIRRKLTFSGWILVFILTGLYGFGLTQTDQIMSFLQVLLMGLLLVVSLFWVFYTFSDLNAPDLEKERRRTRKTEALVGGPLSVVVGSGIVYAAISSLQAGYVYVFVRGGGIFYKDKDPVFFWLGISSYSLLGLIMIGLGIWLMVGYQKKLQ